MERKNRRSAVGFLFSKAAYVNGEHFSVPGAEREGFVLFVAFLLGVPGNSVQKML